VQKIKTGILGCGGAARIHAEALKHCPEREVVGVYAPAWDRENAEKFAWEYGMRVFASKEELFEACECIHICTPSGQHCSDSLECIAQGKHVVCEKPLCMTNEECDALEQALAAHPEIGFMPVSQHRYSEAYQKVERALDMGEFGNLISGSVEVMYFRDPAYYQASSWRGTRKDDGGVLMNQGIHEIDVLLGLLGKPMWVAATAGNRYHEIEAADTVSAFGQFENGTNLFLSVSTAAAPGYPGKHTIFGTGGMVQVEEDRIVKWSTAEETDGTGEVSAKNDFSGKSDPLAIDMTLHAVQFTELSNVIRNGVQQKYKLEDATGTIRFLNAVFQAAQEGCIVRL